MLAYELFYNNKDSGTSDVKNQYPVKKVFYKNNKVTIDKKPIEEYGSSTTKNTKQLQDWLQMPLNTVDVKQLNLPDFRTGGNSANPYVEVYGSLKTNVSLNTVLTLSIGKKPNQITHTLDFVNEIQSDSNGIVKLNLDRKNYYLNSNTLFSEYVKSGLIDKDGILNIDAYDKIIRTFLGDAQKTKPEFKKPGNIKFRIYILPDDSTIEFGQQSKMKKNPEQTAFTDYFGNSVSEYASTPTKTAKFLTYDDPAFSINCMKKECFYKNLGIGNTSQEKIFTDSSQTFTISRLQWTFIDISNPDSKFKETKKGILSQLYENYRLLSKDSGVNEMAQLKVICIQSNQAKQELLIDENLTMDKMKKMFPYDNDIILRDCFEVLIDNTGKNPLWDTYLYAVKNFLAGNKIPRDYLLSYFTKILKQKRYDWLKTSGDRKQKEFFQRADFCLKYLCSG